jgi:hypothetical protein
MILSYQCLWCGKAYSLGDEYSGRKVRCKACGQIQQIPAANGRPAGVDDPSAAVGYSLVPVLPSQLGSTAPASSAPAGAVGDGLAYRERVRGRRTRKWLGRLDLVGMLLWAWRWPVRFGAGSASRVEQESLALLFLSIADLLVTHALLRSGPAYYESNPIAHWFFARWNIAGMTVLKFSVVAFVVLIGEVVERRRPGLGKGMLTVASLMTAAVVAYGLKLLFGSGMA